MITRCLMLLSFVSTAVVTLAQDASFESAVDAAQLEWKTKLLPATTDFATLDRRFHEFESAEHAEKKTFEEHMLQLAALKLAYDELAKPLKQTDLGAILRQEGGQQSRWAGLLKPAATDKDALEKKYKRLQGVEQARPATDDEHQSQLGTLQIVYNEMANDFADPEHPTLAAKTDPFWSNVHLAKSSAYSDRSKPAQFGWTRENGDDVYTAKGAFTTEYFGTDPMTSDSPFIWNWWGGFDFDVSSDKKKNPGTLTQTLAALAYKKTTGTYDEHAMHVTYLPSISHIANRNFKTQSLVAQFLTEPGIVLGDLPINVRKHGVLFGPQLGAEFGEAIDKTKGKSPEDGGFTRGYMKWSLNDYPPGLKNKLYIYLDNTTRFLGDADYHSFNFLNAGASYDLSDQVSLSVDYEIGRDAPKFTFGTKLTVGLGLQF